MGEAEVGTKIKSGHSIFEMSHLKCHTGMDLERKTWNWWLSIRKWRLYSIVISL